MYLHQLVVPSTDNEGHDVQSSDHFKRNYVFNWISVECINTINMKNIMNDNAFLILIGSKHSLFFIAAR